MFDSFATVAENETLKDFKRGDLLWQNNIKIIHQMIL